MNTEDIIELIKNDPWMMDLLKIVKQLSLPDWWIGAGFVRGKVWDILHDYAKRTPLPDIDVIYFDKKDFSEDEMEKETTKAEAKYEKLLKKSHPEINWSVTNQARMHVFHSDLPYRNSKEALAQWVETATCVGVHLDNNDKLVLIAPQDIHDLVNLIVQPTPTFRKNPVLFKKRLKEKEWLKKWPKLKVVTKKNDIYYVYILRTSSNTLYVGQTNNLERRLKEHQDKNSKTAKYLRRFTSIELVHSEFYKSRAKAMKREGELKSWPKSKKEVLVKTINK